jgi:doubled CXXCH motif protein
MRRRTRSARPSKTERQAASGSWRGRLAVLAGLVTVVCLGSAFRLSKDIRFLMPGPLASAHGTIENCEACHTKSGTDNLSWLVGLGHRDPHADSKACLTCHKMPDTVFNAHGAQVGVLKQSTTRLTKVAAETPAPLWARAQSAAFPTDAVVARGLDCATCHREHQGANFNLKKMSNEQCHSCHVVKFDSFDGHHPKFENYPFRRRPRIIYDHPGHALKHFPEVAKKGPAGHISAIPTTCSTCHNSSADRRIMAVAPFEQTCSGCHLEQITGKERVSGPKGIAFLSLPGLDLQTLKKKNAPIGEWPDASEAELTPFMKVMISRSERGRALIKTVDRLDLQDLSHASDEQIKAVASLVWEIKRLLYALIAGKASDMLGDLNVACGAKLSANLVADLSASISRDVVTGVHQQWLPNLGKEMANRQAPRDDQGTTCWQVGGWTTSLSDSSPAAAGDAPPPDDEQPRPRAIKAAVTDAENAAARQGGMRTPETSSGKADNIAVAQAAPSIAAQTDDLLNPTAEELRGISASGKDGGKGVAAPAGSSSPDAPPTAAAEPPADSDVITAAPEAKALPAVFIESSVEPESWAEYGGWYRQDYAIFYRPIGHKDKFIFSWLSLTGPHAPVGDKSPAAAVFDYLISKDAQGSCTKCHSVDEVPGKGRIVNFAPLKVEARAGRATHFIHEPHFGVLENRGCLTCHNIERGTPFLQSYEQGDPEIFASNFGAVSKELCQTCHTSGMARQDCLLCHKYHVNGVMTPIMNTRVPIPTE